MPLSLVEVRLRLYIGLRVPIRFFFTGPGGYVAAIKAAQLGLKVRSCLLSLGACMSQLLQDCVYREAWGAWRDLLKRRLYPVQGHAQ
jgi:hypothetical protein